jgi:hypothetical protein
MPGSFPTLKSSRCGSDSPAEAGSAFSEAIAAENRGAGSSFARPCGADSTSGATFSSRGSILLIL